MSSPAPPRAAAVVTLLGLAVATLGVFALPLQTTGPAVRDDISFVTVRAAVANYGQPFSSEFGEFWWRYGLFLALAVLLAGLCLLVLGVAIRAAGIVIAAVGVLALAGQGAALAQTSSFGGRVPVTASLSFRSADKTLVNIGKSGSLYDHARVGIWVGYAGLFVVVAGGLVAIITGRRSAA